MPNTVTITGLDGRMRRVEVLEEDKIGRKRIDISLDVSDDRFWVWVTPEGNFTAEDTVDKRSFPKYRSYEAVINFINQHQGIPASTSAGGDVTLSLRGAKASSKPAEPRWIHGDTFNTTSPTQVVVGVVGPYTIWRNSAGKYAVEEWRQEGGAVPVKIPNEYLNTLGISDKEQAAYRAHYVDEDKLPAIFDYIESTTGYSLGLQEGLPRDVLDIDRMPSIKEALRPTPSTPLGGEFVIRRIAMASPGYTMKDKPYKTAKPSTRRLEVEAREAALQAERDRDELVRLRTERTTPPAEEETE